MRFLGAFLLEAVTKGSFDTSVIRQLMETDDGDGLLEYLLIFVVFELPD
jgi:hypothetical protein